MDIAIITRLPSDLQSSTEIHQFVAGPAKNYDDESEHLLIRKYGVSLGQIWSAMAVFRGRRDRRIAGGAGSPDTCENRDDERPKRARKNTIQDYYVSSGTIQVGSSSPLAEDSQGTSSVGYIDAESHMLPSLPEDETLRLASCVFRHILYFGPPQESESTEVVVEFRDARVRLDATTPALERRIMATDDGGFCLREKSAGVFKLSKNCVAILEAKRRFQCVMDGRPVISDTCFGQMTCEALVARLADPIGELQHASSVFVIHATQHYLCFLQYEISDEYLSDFESTAPTSFIYVNSTPWFDLNTRGGRERVVANICAMMRWARD
ncbi:Uncharacterized protein TPAR_05433, partial [Tolypocladium paradoxum]